MRINKITNRIPVAIITLSFIAALFRQALDSLNWGHNSWQITEWLINYKGGFVRRGLPGEIIHFAAAQTGIHANHITILLSLLFFILLIIILIKKASGRIPAILILSPIILGSAANQGFVIRKDVFVILLFIACMSILKSKLTHTTKILLINITACIAILSHESFFFFGVPYLILINGLYQEKIHSDEVNEIRSLFLSVVHFLPSIIVFLLVIISHGDATTANAINSSWISLWGYINPNEIGIEDPSAAIDSIQWSVKQGLALSFSVFTSKYIFFWLLTIVTCIYITLSIPVETPPNGPRHTHNRNKLAAILTMQIICISPLFVLGWDFGRWIFLWTVSSIVIYLYDFNQPFLLEAISKKAEPIVNSVFKPNKASIWILLFFGVQGCCWSSLGYIASTPIGSMIISFKLAHFVKTILLNLG